MEGFAPSAFLHSFFLAQMAELARHKAEDLWSRQSHPWSQKYWELATREPTQMASLQMSQQFKPERHLKELQTWQKLRSLIIYLCPLDTNHNHSF